MSIDALAQPPEGKGKPAHAGPSPFIQFPVPQNSVGRLHSHKVHETGKRASLLVPLPMPTHAFPTAQTQPAAPECGAR